MKTLLATLLVLVPSLAFAQADLGKYNRALGAFNANDFDTAAHLFYELSENSTDAETRPKSEYYLAQSLHKRGLLLAAMVRYSPIVAAGKAHPLYLKAVEGLVNLQQQLDDRDLIPSLLNKEFNDSWAQLPAAVLARINYLVADVAQRRKRFDEARSFLEAVPKDSNIYAKAQYRLGVVLADPAFPGGPKPDEAIARFEEVLSLTSPNQQHLVLTQQLALIAAGRLYYGTERYAKAVEMYERVPRYSRYWDQALFENGFARFRNEDEGGALGSLQALHAPQFAGAFQPESWILKATVYYFACLYKESSAALQAFDEIYSPMFEQLKPLIENERPDVGAYFELVGDEKSRLLPRPVLLWIRANEHVAGVVGLLRRLDEEKTAIAATTAWQGSKIREELTDALDQNRATLVQVGGLLVKKRLRDAHGDIKTFAGQAQIIRFETSKAEKELFEQGVDQVAMLKQKGLYRPQMPAEDWNYWKFQGEFWIDEIGYYQYTLKNGCPAGSE